MILDFLTFKTFITPTVLIVFYIIGAFIIPLFSWFIKIWIQKKYFKNIQFNIETKYKLLAYTIFILCFLCMELFWRMAFEVIIAYFNMHDALLILSTS